MKKQHIFIIALIVLYFIFRKKSIVVSPDAVTKADLDALSKKIDVVAGTIVPYDATPVNNLLSLTGAEFKTVDQIRALTGTAAKVYPVTLVSGAKRLAVYKPDDSLTMDNGTTILVDADFRRYSIMTEIELLNLINNSFNVFS